MSAVLTTYLQDHHAGSAAGIDTFDRVAASHGVPKVRTAVARIADEVREDQAALEQIMAACGPTPSLLKDTVGKVGEKVSRLKPNDRLIERSPLSDYLELEMLTLAVHGKALLWRTLLEMPDRRLDVDQLTTLAERAERQEAELDALRRLMIPRLSED